MNQLPSASYPGGWRRRGCRLGCLGILAAAALLAVFLVVLTHVIGAWSGGTPVSLRRSPPGAASSPSDAELTALGAKVAPSIVDVSTELGYQHARGAGTGIVLSGDGEILTNNHVINGATSIRVHDIGDDRDYQAEVLGYDRTKDVAVLRLSGASGLVTAPIAEADHVAVGDPVAAIGNAGGTGGPPTVAGGTVTGLNRSVHPTDELTGSTERLEGLIEVAADVEPGDSGGPLVNTDGQVIGMDTAASVNYRYQTSGGTGFAIPIAAALEVAQHISAGQGSDTVHIGPTGILGVSVLTGDGETPFPSDQATGGAIVAAVQPGSPADTAGLGQGAVIVGLDGHPVASATTLTNLLVQHHPGDVVSLQWVDPAGQRHRSSATLAPGPPA